MPIDGELSVPQDGFNVDCYGLSYARKEESSRCCSVPPLVLLWRQHLRLQ